jgi:homoserine kinase
MRKVRVSTPASTANLGAGFDCLALALNLRNVVELWDTGKGSGVEIDVEGEGAERVPLDTRNLIYQAAARVFERVGRGPAGTLRLHAVNAIPLGSGMGSSAASVVGGLVAANALVEGGLEREAILRMAYAMEGHPDNAAAALWGGLTLVSAEEKKVTEKDREREREGRGARQGEGERERESGVVVRRLEVPGMRLALALPAVRLSTAEARAALPAWVPRADAVFNVGHALFTVQALAAGDEALLRWAVADRLHEPYRERLIPGYGEAVRAAREAGAAAAALSGAGPAVVAFAFRDHWEIAGAMQRAFQARGVEARTFVLPVDGQGVTVEVGSRQ